MKKMDNIYTSKILSDRINKLIAQKGIKKNTLITDCGLNPNFLSQLSNKRVSENTIEKGSPVFYVAKIADYLDVSVDYLLGRTDYPEIQFNGRFDGLPSIIQDVIENFSKLSIEGQQKVSNAVKIRLEAENQLKESDSLIKDIVQDVGGISSIRRIEFTTDENGNIESVKTE